LLDWSLFLILHKVVLSPDGKYLTTGSEGTIQLWLWQPKELIAKACGRLTRNLAPEVEWPLYLGDERYRKTCPNLP
jgi:hypothetical protein